MFAAGRLEVRLLELNARASREPVATPPAKTASVHLRVAYPDESRKQANANQLAVLAPLVRSKLSRSQMMNRVINTRLCLPTQFQLAEKSAIR
jgi:hypothetical protein